MLCVSKVRSVCKGFAVLPRSVECIYHPVASLGFGWRLLPSISTQCLGYAVQGQIHACTAQGCPRIINSAMGSFSGLLPLCNLPVFSGSSGSLPVLLPDSSSFHHPHSPPSDCAYTQGQAAGIEVEGKNLIQVYSILVGPHFLPSEQGVLTPPSKMRQLWHCTEAGMQEKQSRRQSHPL